MHKLRPLSRERSIAGLCLVWMLLMLVTGVMTSAQHKGHDMPDTSKPKPTPRRQENNAVRKDDIQGMPKESSPSPTPSPERPETNQTSPSPSPEMKMDMPGMLMTSASPSPTPQTPPEMKMSMPASPSSGATGEVKRMPGMEPMNMGPLMVMSGNDMGIRVGSSNKNILSMGAMGSGTSWQPSSVPLHMYHKVAGDWLLMFHYNATAGINSQGGPRGATKFESSNWFMPMFFHKLAAGTLQLRGMFSFEPFTFPRGGSPLLFQTGESYKGQPLIDRQHPHDLFMELSATYTMPLGERGTWFVYFGYPGEPALGPTAFMHRASASENPSAPLSHHLQDSTHISYGVFTAGFTYRWFKLEGSVFNGREPDENRYNFEAHPWASRSVRLSFAPNRNWSTQVSYGFLRKPEELEPDTDIRRLTASVQYNRPFGRGNWATALIWGRNHTSSPSERHNLNGYIAESTLNFLDRNYLYLRLELVDKNELLRLADRLRLGLTEVHPSFRIGAYTFGGARDLWDTNQFSMAVGSDVMFYSRPTKLEPIYGSSPVSWRLFLRLRPGKTKMSQMH